MTPEWLGMTPEEWLGAVVCVVALVAMAWSADRWGRDRRKDGRR